MYNSNIPTEREIPSTAKLIKSTIIAAVVALALLVTVVMPAEYGIDPTGIGKAIGLKRMGEIKVSLAKEAAADLEMDAIAESPEVAIVTAPTTEATVAHSESMQVTLAPDEGTEIKVAMSKGAIVNYSWSTNGGKANFDAHADSRKLKIDYHSYEKGSESEKLGTLIAAFDGSHGWFWRNRTAQTMTITLEVSGEFSDMKHMK
ncbi:transmembrane anchor protein [Coraliomargarita sp. W4R72]